MKRWQFSLGASFVTTALFAIGCALFRMSPNDIFRNHDLDMLGAIFLGSSLGVLVGYGLKRHDGALAGGWLCGIAGIFCHYFYQLLDAIMSGGLD